MDTQSPRENEKVLHAFIEQEDPHIVGLVGIDALTVLARELPAEKFKQFLQQSIQDAAQLKQGVMQPDRQQPGVPPATGPAPGEQP